MPSCDSYLVTGYTSRSSLNPRCGDRARAMLMWLGPWSMQPRICMSMITGAKPIAYIQRLPVLP